MRTLQAYTVYADFLNVNIPRIKKNDTRDYL